MALLPTRRNMRHTDTLHLITDLKNSLYQRQAARLGFLCVWGGKFYRARVTLETWKPHAHEFTLRVLSPTPFHRQV